MSQSRTKDCCFISNLYICKDVVCLLTYQFAWLFWIHIWLWNECSMTYVLNSCFSLFLPLFLSFLFLLFFSSEGRSLHAGSVWHRVPGIHLWENHQGEHRQSRMWRMHQVWHTRVISTWFKKKEKEVEKLFEYLSTLWQNTSELRWPLHLINETNNEKWFVLLALIMRGCFYLLNPS